MQTNLATDVNVGLQNCRNDFPILQQKMNGKPLVYLDNSATTQKPKVVIQALENFYALHNANVHRGLYALSEEATQLFEGVRRKVKDFIKADEICEIIFTQGTTASINLVASSFGDQFIAAGDCILISAMEHHSNIVPWQQLCARKGATLKVIPLLEDGSLDLMAYEKLLDCSTKLVSIIHISNALGTINPIKKMIALAHEKNIPVLVDGAQAVSHMEVDVKDLDCDFYAFSSHKCYGPTGVGVLYGKKKWLEKMPPYQTGGDMIRTVSFSETQYNELPYKFEAGTPNIAGVVGFGAALDYLQQMGLAAVADYEHRLLNLATQILTDIPRLKIIGVAAHKAAIISFVMDGIHPHDLATILDQEGIAIRAGHHCAMPLMNELKLSATARVSFGMYNTEQDAERLRQGLLKAIEIFTS